MQDLVKDRLGDFRCESRGFGFFQDHFQQSCLAFGIEHGCTGLVFDLGDLARTGKALCQKSHDFVIDPIDFAADVCQLFHKTIVARLSCRKQG